MYFVRHCLVWRYEAIELKFRQVVGIYLKNEFVHGRDWLNSSWNILNLRKLWCPQKINVQIRSPGLFFIKPIYYYQSSWKFSNLWEYDILEFMHYFFPWISVEYFMRWFMALSSFIVNSIPVVTLCHNYCYWLCYINRFRTFYSFSQ